MAAKPQSTNHRQTDACVRKGAVVQDAATLARGLIMPAVIYLTFEILAAAPLQPVLAQSAIEVQKKAAEARYYDSLLEYEKIPRSRVNTDTALAAARSAWALGLSERAAQEYDLALRDDNLGEAQRARVLFSRGIVELQQGRYQSACLYAQKITEILPEPGPLRSRAYLLWGQALLALSSYAAAEEKLSFALSESSPDDISEAHYQLAECQFTLGKYEEARKHFEAVPVHTDRTPAAIRYLAKIALQSGKPSIAAFWLNKGREEFPDNFLDSWVDYALTQVAIGQNDRPMVKSLRESAASKYPPTDSWVVLLNAAAETFEWKQGNSQ